MNKEKIFQTFQFNKYHSSEVRMHPFTLSFINGSAPLENEYQANLFAKNLLLIRLVLLGALLMFLSFLFFDKPMASSHAYGIFITRYLIVMPGLIFLSASTYLNLMKKYSQYFLLISVLFLHFISYLGLAFVDEFHVSYAFAMGILVLGSFILLRVRFWYLFLFSLILLPFCFWDILYFLPLESANAASMVVVFFFTVLIGLFVAYSNEINQRKSYFLNTLLDWQNQIIHSENQKLENQVLEHTAELSTKSIELDVEMRQRMKIEAEKNKLQSQLYQAQKMDAIGRLAAGIAHDFNNILTAVLGYCDLLSLKLENEECHPNLLEIKKAAVRATRFTSQLLSLSRKQKMKPELLDLNVLVLDMKRMMHRFLGKGRSLSLELSEKPAFVKADPGQMQQVLMNLVINAADAMCEGGKLTISTLWNAPHAPFEKCDLEGKCAVCLQVRDNGHGMDQDTLENIFEPFFTTKNPGKGTGLGLAVVYGIIKQHSGWIDVKSEPKQGTIFSIYLQQQHGACDPNKSKISLLKTLPEHTQYSLLYLEANHEVQQFTLTLLRQAGYTVHPAGSVKQAQAILSECDHIDALFCNLTLPDGNAFELFQWLKRQERTYRWLFFSEQAEGSELVKKLVTLKMPFIAKPYSAQEFLDKVTNILS